MPWQRPEERKKEMSGIPGFEEESFSDGEFSFPVFRKGDGFGVILMHELPGLTRETVDFAEYIAANGFHVVMPLLFGSPLQNATLGTLKSLGLCIRREFNCLVAGHSSPITNALRGLCRKIHGDRGGRGVGAIGMCFTGGFVLSMMLEPALLAPVIAQPSLPFFSKCVLDIEPETLAIVANRPDDVTLLGLRFELDWISPKQRMDRLQETFSGITRSGNPRFERIDVPGKGHSTLAFDYKNAVERGIDTRQRVLAHLQQQLL
jgi:dienelactone hydrolase